MPSLYVIRHGQTTHNAQGIIQGPRIDSHLSDLGQQQARAVGSALTTVGLDAVYTSPLSRARQTAQAIVDQHPHQPALQVAAEAYELDYGDYSGRIYQEVRDDIAQILDAWQMGFPDQMFPGGESAVLAQVRLRPLADRLRQEALEHDVALVAHGRINRVFLSMVTGAGLGGLERFPQANANITELAVRADGVELVRVNDQGHLALASGSFS
ncbi:MAG: histidine phosphatase family protein [Thermoplasmatota archaeon]